MKQTKNKYLRELVRNYEIELQRPKGLKYIDMFIKQVPDGMDDITVFISGSIHKECGFITKYKGYRIASACLPRTQIIRAKESNLYNICQ